MGKEIKLNALVAGKKTGKPAPNAKLKETLVVKLNIYVSETLIGIPSEVIGNLDINGEDVKVCRALGEGDIYISKGKKSYIIKTRDLIGLIVQKIK